MKSFIYSHEPSEWGFGVSEMLDGEVQLVDITDDLTGKPSLLAKENIPMHVNEVGHNPKLTHTVHSLEKDDRTIEYYLKIDTPMKRGETVELFVDYFDVYEDVRERKGYGLANIDGTIKSDEDLGTRIMRNYGERDEIKEILSDIALWKMYDMLEWLDSIYQELARMVGRFVVESLKSDTIQVLPPSDCPSALQFVALRRLHWLGGIFKEKIAHFKEANEHAETRDASSAGVVAMFGGVVEQCSVVANRLQGFSFSTLLEAMSKVPELTDSDGINIKSFWEAEVVEELCYGVKDVVQAPLNSSMWCGVARDLTRRLCLATASVLWREDIDASEKLVQLLRSYQSEALEAARRVSCPTSSDTEAFTFEAPFRPGYGIANADLVLPSDVSSCPSGSQAFVQQVETGEVDGKIDLRGIMSKKDQANLNNVQSNWYLCWQVVFVVNAFASAFLKGSQYSLKELCSILGVTETQAWYAIKKGMLDPAPIERRQRKKSKSSPSLPRKAPKRSAPRPRGNKILFWKMLWPSLVETFGWHLEKGNRPNDNYFCPEGVTRGKGFKPRKDFFDSNTQVTSALKQQARFTHDSKLQELVAEFHACESLYSHLKGSLRLKNFRSDEDLIRWLRDEVAKDAGYKRKDPTHQVEAEGNDIQVVGEAGVQANNDVQVSGAEATGHQEITLDNNALI